MHLEVVDNSAPTAETIGWFRGSSSKVKEQSALLCSWSGGHSMKGRYRRQAERRVGRKLRLRPFASNVAVRIFVRPAILIGLYLLLCRGALGLHCDRNSDHSVSISCSAVASADRSQPKRLNRRFGEVPIIAEPFMVNWLFPAQASMATAAVRSPFSRTSLQSLSVRLQC